MWTTARSSLLILSDDFGAFGFGDSILKSRASSDVFQLRVYGYSPGDQLAYTVLMLAGGYPFPDDPGRVNDPSSLHDGMVFHRKYIEASSILQEECSLYLINP